ncbi:MAG: hypothetical protein Q9174_006719, partial [Haloplaca sp. 1 TL-2023]
VNCDTYVAGLFDNAFVIEQLLWYVVGKQTNGQLPQRPPDYRAPTWSWLSLDANITWPLFFETPLIKVLQIKTTLVNQSNPTGPVKGGFVIIRGPLRYIDLQRLGGKKWSADYEATNIDGSRIGNLEIFPDTQDLVQLQSYCIPMRIQYSYQVEGLLLAPTEQKDTEFNRTGYFRSSDPRVLESLSQVDESRAIELTIFLSHPDLMDPCRKRQRGMAFPQMNDGGLAEDSGHEGTIKQEDFHQEHTYSSHYSALFLSRHSSEEPRNSRKIPSSLDNDDEEAFLQKGSYSAAPSKYVSSATQTAATSPTQQRERTLAGSSTHVTAIKREPAVHISTTSPPNQAIRPSSTPKQRSTPTPSAQRENPTLVRDHSRVTTENFEPAVQNSTSLPSSQPKATHAFSLPMQRPASTSSSTRIIKTPREPNEALKRYATSLYTRYDPNRNNIGPLAGKFTGTFRIYDAYTLVTDPTMDIGNLPTSGVRIDDLLAGKLLMSNYGASVLHQAWPAEFDNKGMIRATRIPLGHAAKRWRQVGETDIEGKSILPGQEGWYYDWWR